MCVFTFNSFGQVLDDVLTHSVYNVENGLPTNEVYFCHQDSRGYLWLSTDLGLVRYDGTNFKTYAKTEGLPGTTVFKTYEDDKGRLWILTYREGVCYLEGDSIVIPDFNENLKDLLSPKNYIQNINVLSDSVYLTTRYSQDSLFIAHVDGDILKVPIPYLETIAERESKYLWELRLKNGEYVCGLTGRRGRDRTIHPLRYSSFSPSNDVKFHDFSSQEYARYCHESQGDSIFVISQRGRVAMIDEKGTVSVSQLSSDVLDIEIYNENILIATLGDGIYQYRGSLNREGLVGHYFPNEAITSIDVDNQGKIWLTSLYNGLINVPSFFSRSYIIPHVGNSQNATKLNVRNDTVAYVVEDTLHFVRILNDKLKKIKSIPMDVEAYRSVLYASNLAWLPNWQVYYHHQIFSPDFSSDQILKGDRISTEIRPFVYTVYDHNGVFYLGTRHGLIYSSDESIIFDSNKELDFDYEVYCISGLDEHTLLLGTQDGVFEFDIRSKSIHSVHTSDINFSVNDLRKDEFGRVWIATKEDGLYTLENGELSKVELSNFSNQLVCYTIQFSDKFAWLGSNKGILKFSFDNDSIFFNGAFSKLDGLAFNFVKEMHLDGENVILRSSDRLSTMPVDLLMSSEGNPEVFLESIRVGNVQYNAYQFNGLEFPKGMNNLEFTVRPNILDQSGLEMEYRLVGVDENWRRLVNNTVSLVKVPPGKYQFDVRVRNASNDWSDTVLSYDFIISKRLVDKLWFRWILISFVLSIIAVSLYVRRVRIRRKEHLENQMIRSGLRSLRAQINPHFMFNALNSIRHFMLDENLTKADGYLVKFSGLLRGVLENMEEYKVPLREEVELLEAYLSLEESRLRYGLDWSISINENVDTENLMIPTMLFQPLLENSIWHGIEPLKHTGQLSLSFEQKEGTLICRLVDDGVGFDFAERHFKEGIGLRNIQERLKLYEQLDNKPYSISIDSSTDISHHGTIITINIPV